MSSDSKLITAQNILFQSEFSAIADACRKENISVIALKGISFFDRIYNSAERSLTDVDILIRREDLEGLCIILRTQGYQERKEQKWSENSFKYIFYKFHLGLEIVLEVHTQLLADKKNDQWEHVPFKNFRILAPQDELLYLAYHYAHQHTLLKLKWLHDIFLLTKKSPELWNETLWKMAKIKKLHSALLFTAHALNSKYSTQITLPKSFKLSVMRPLMTIEFIENPYHFSVKYYVTKHAVKDSLLKALIYDLRWIYFVIKKRFTH